MGAKNSQYYAHRNLHLSPLYRERSLLEMENTAESRADLKRSMPKVDLALHHVNECRILPNRLALLEAMPKDAVCAELGVDKGDFSAEILKRMSPSRLYLIDSWQSERYRGGKLTVEEKFATEIEAGTVTVKIGLSVEVLNLFDDDTFDWVYIDTDHSYETTKKELETARQKVKPGGRIAGHDFTTGNTVKPWPYGVIEACHEFCDAFDWQYEFLTLESHGHFSFCLKPIG